MSEIADDAAAIESFATLLEETGTGRHHRRPDDADPELIGLLDVARVFARAARPRPASPAQRTGRPLPSLGDVAERPTAEFRDQLLSRLLSAYPTAVAPAPTVEALPAQRSDPRSVRQGGRPVAPRPRRSDDAVPPRRPVLDLANQKTQFVRTVQQRLGGRTRLAALVGVAAGAIAISGVSLASNTALPGEALYTVKSFGEQARLFVAGSDADRGRLHLDFARIRLVEARQVDPDAIGAVLAVMDREITEGARLLFTAGMSGAGAGPIESVAAFVQQQRADVQELRTTVAASADPAQRSLDLLADVEIRATELRAALTSGCTADATDELGPTPAC